MADSAKHTDLELLGLGFEPEDTADLLQTSECSANIEPGEAANFTWTTEEEHKSLIEVIL